jgi:alpha-methylacyl-CoA racemase
MLQAKLTGSGQVVDAAMVDGSALLMAMTYGYLSDGRWTDERGMNHLDGNAPWYRTYRCADDRHMAVGCIEPPFYADLLRVLDLADDPDFKDQNDRSTWPAMHRRLEASFATRARDAWVEAFEGSLACATAVLSMRESIEHPHNLARRTFSQGADGSVQPTPGPRFAGTPAGPPKPAPVPGAHTREVLTDIGVSNALVDELYELGVISG